MQKYERFCLFAHYDRLGGITDHVLFYLAALQNCGFKTVLVSNSHLSSAAQEKLSGLTVDVMIRPGKGLDFASHAIGFAKHQGSVGGLLLLANDSVFGPLGELREVVEKLLNVDADVYGMVESHEIATHLQSWFLIIRPSVYRHPAFTVFLAQDFQLMSKEEVIINGELGFSAMLRREEFCVHAHYRQNLGPINYLLGGVNPTTTALWKNLILRHDVPFIKIQLLRDNPEGITGLDEWRELVSTKSSGLAAMIWGHLQREVAGVGGKDSLRCRGNSLRLGSHAILILVDHTYRQGARQVSKILFFIYKLLRVSERRLSKWILWNQS